MAAIILVLVFMLTVQPALAANEASLQISYLDSGISFSIYHAATYENGVYVPTDTYAGYSICWDMHNAEAMWALASTLAAYTARDTIPAAMTVQTDINGKAVFSPLLSGVYLVIGESYTKDGCRYTPTPFVAVIPDAGLVTADVKCSQEPVIPQPEPDDREISVQKCWNDTSEADRPESISVQLLRDGSVCDTVLLNSENGWQHTWTHLDANYRWQVTEETVPAHYTVQITQNGNCFVITNTHDSEAASPADPSPSDSPETGDNSQTELYLALLAGSLLLFVFALYLRKKYETGS